MAAPAGTRVARRIDHVGVLVRDVDEAARWYVEELGAAVSHVGDLLDGTARLAYLEIGDTTLQLVQPLRQGHPLWQLLEEQGEGLHHLCFEVADIEGGLQALRATSTSGPYLGPKGIRVCFLDERRSGVLVEITEPGPVSPPLPRRDREGGR